MTVFPLSRGWTYRTPLGPFQAADAATTAETPVHLPHDAMRDLERSPQARSAGAMAYYPGAAFAYLHRLEVPAQWAGRTIHLEIEGAQRRSQVFVNDEFVGNRANGYARYFVELGPYLRYGQTNELRIEVRTGEDSRWYSGAGLHRPVRLHVAPAVHVVPDGVTVRTLELEDDRATVEVATTVRNASPLTATRRVRTVLRGPGGESVSVEDSPVTLIPGEQALVRQRFWLSDPALWSPEAPQLHTAEVALDDGEEPVIETFGVRTISVDPQRGLRLNGQPVLLRGACVHHDNGPLGGAAIGRAEERRIELLKEAGFNALRASHNPFSSAMLEACDRLGMLVMDEAFDMWTRFKSVEDYALDFPQWWREDLSAMIAKDRNHPSVIMYSIGNEIIETGTPHGSRLARQLAEQVRELDPTRPVTNGVNAMLAVIDQAGDVLDPSVPLNEAGDVFNLVGASEAASLRTEESSSVLDVVGFNYAESRYALDTERFPSRVIVGSETFAPKIGELWPLVLEHPHVIGDFTWTGWDYLGEVGIGATAYAEDPDAVAALEREYPFLSAWTGDLDITGHRRPVSYYREIVFGLRTEPYIAVLRPEHHDHTVTMQSPWAWSDSISSWTWPGFEGKAVQVEVYADADEILLKLDGVEVARAEVGARLPMLAELETEYRPGELVAIALRHGEEVGRTALRTAGPERLVATADRTVLRADDDDLAFVEIELRDAEGTLATAAEHHVTVTVDGAAVVLAGMASARPSTEERFVDATWRTFTAAPSP